MVRNELNQLVNNGMFRLYMKEMADLLRAPLTFNLVLIADQTSYNESADKMRIVITSKIMNDAIVNFRKLDVK